MKQEILLQLVQMLLNSEWKTEKSISDAVDSPQVNSPHKKWDYIIVRSYYSGVIYGKYIGRNDEWIILHDSRRLWYWKAKWWITLTAVAESWIDSSSKITAPINICITDTTVCEIIKCSDKCIKSMNEQPNYIP